MGIPPSPLQIFIIVYGQMQSWTPQLVLQPLGQSPPTRMVALGWAAVLAICPAVLGKAALHQHTSCSPSLCAIPSPHQCIHACPPGLGSACQHHEGKNVSNSELPLASRESLLQSLLRTAVLIHPPLLSLAQAASCWGLTFSAPGETRPPPLPA